MYLDYKDSTEYSGIESYINEKMTKFDYTWFPISRASVLKDENDIIEDEK